MSKRSRSPAPLPPSKRAHRISSNPPLSSNLPRTFDTLLYDELILFIFSYLSFKDLCNAQLINRNWSRLSQDNQLWKNLYIKEYGRSRLRGGKGFVKRMDGREIKALPSRAASHHQDFVRDWKWMFRISSNWRTGRCNIAKLEEDQPPDNSLLLEMTTRERELSDRIHMVLAGPLMIHASSRPSHSPPIVILYPSSPPYTIHIHPAHGHLVQCTSLAVDQSPPASGISRFAVCLSSGELAAYAVSSISSSSPSPSRIHSYTPPARTARTTPIVQAAYHHPLLVTLSESFALSLYDLSSDVMHLATHLTSFTCFPPASLVLTAPDSRTYKLLVTYASPVYPKHWSIGVTEVIIVSSSSLPSSPSNSSTYPLTDHGRHFRVVSTRSVRAYDLPPGWMDETTLRAVREQWGRKVGRVAGTQTDGKWLVLAPTELPCVSCPMSLFTSPPSSPDSSPSPSSSTSKRWEPSNMPLQLYRISFPSLPSSSPTSPSPSGGGSPKLTFVRHLYGQTGAVAGLALADGRCVSLGVDGRVWAWDLEGGEGVEVASPWEDGVMDDENEGEDPCERLKRGMKGMVVFDERRVVSSRRGGIVVRNFDV
ncbi:hypothetical protein OF83DRAFT_1129515 [Amylostereum chailletii]|nr:hypothetical protein OF83DRAFT_1129515 [Amylostereum chailletii]